MPTYLKGQKSEQKKTLPFAVKIKPFYLLKRNQHISGIKITAYYCFKFSKKT